MVAYSFKAQFIDPIEMLEKRQTVRAFRKRHARPGEPIQLYAAMRTRHCRKILTPDPICIAVREIAIRIDEAHPQIIASISIDGVNLIPAAIEDFACKDGFDDQTYAAGFSRKRMGEFWLNNHGNGQFSGVVIQWEPR